MKDPIVKHVYNDISSRNKTDHWILRFLKKYLTSKDKSVAVSFDGFKTDLKVLIGSSATDYVLGSGSTNGIALNWQLVDGVWTPTIVLTSSTWQNFSAINSQARTGRPTLATSTAKYRYNPLGYAVLAGDLKYEIDWAYLVSTGLITPSSTSFSSNDWIDFDVIPNTITEDLYASERVTFGGATILFDYTINNTQIKVDATVISGSIPTTGTSVHRLDLQGIQFAPTP